MPEPPAHGKPRSAAGGVEPAVKPVPNAIVRQWTFQPTLPLARLNSDRWLAADSRGG